MTELNIRYMTTVGYSDAGLSDGSYKKYHIRENVSPGAVTIAGYEKIADISAGTFPDGSQSAFELGYNPSRYSSQDYAQNPIVCDGLVLFGAHSRPYDQSYDQIVFKRPALTYYTSNKAPPEGDANSGEFYKYDRLYVDMSKPAFPGVYGSGQKCLRSGAYADFDCYVYCETDNSVDKIDLVTYASPINETFPRFRLLSFYTYWQLRNIFSSVACPDSYLSALADICRFGAVALSVGYFWMVRYSGDAFVSARGVAVNSALDRLLIPFLSYDEYNAAEAALGYLDETTVDRIKQAAGS